MCFLRKIATAVVELAKKKAEVRNSLALIPEWAEYYKGNLLPRTALEEKPLGKDPKSKTVTNEDDDFDFEIMFRFKSLNL